MEADEKKRRRGNEKKEDWWLLVLAAVLTLTGCGGKGSAETAAADNRNSVAMDESDLAEPQEAYGTDGGVSGGGYHRGTVRQADLHRGFGVGDHRFLTELRRTRNRWWRSAAVTSSPAASAAAEAITAPLPIPFGFRRSSTDRF